MITFKELNDSIAKLLDENSSAELAEKVGAIKNQVDELERQDKEFVEKHIDLQRKYVEAVKNNSFGVDKNSLDQEKQPKSFEECLLEAAKAK